MKVAYIGTYPPRECGIGTFTHNLVNSMIKSSKSQSNDVEVYVVAMNDQLKDYAYHDEVKQTIRQEHFQDYLQAAKYINSSNTELCILQHEFGIFGGQNGVYILSLLYELKIPLIVTFHTILKSPTFNEKTVLTEICLAAQKVVAMNHKAIEFLTEIYDIKEEKIVLIEHGVPDIRFNREESRRELKQENRKTLLTFGFIGRNKGIETVLKALPEVVKKHPEVLYIVLGKTHPNVTQHSGEEYREYLQDLVLKLNLPNHVSFLNQFIDTKGLFKYLYASDIYITPYLHEAQISSGTLSYAVGTGSAVVSTPYWHAQELLSDGRGKLFGFNDWEGLSTILMNLLDRPDELHNLRQKASEYGEKLSWTKIGERYMALVKSILDDKSVKFANKEIIFNPLKLPAFSLVHIKRLTDDTGIIQHAKFGIPNAKEGYCLDDNARALLLMLMAKKTESDAEVSGLLSTYLSYIHYMQNQDGTFKNFLSYNRNFMDKVGSEDSFGRTIWAIGYLMFNAPNDAFYQTGEAIFTKAAPNFEKLQSARGIANTIIGICYYLRNNQSDDSMTERLRNIAYSLIGRYENNSFPDWKWFESHLTYDNAILPLALLHSAEILNDDRITEVALESMHFLTKVTLDKGYLSIIGNEEWYVRKGRRSTFAQQPIDAMAMVLMYDQAFNLTKNREYLKKVFTAFMWFHKENELRISLFDDETKGCCDGLESYGVNRNQGAESTIAYLISHFTAVRAHAKYNKINRLASYKLGTLN